ncbi:hypothetical protein TIFTF001_038553 [Ficus carica]|uniref:Leucine-rich repeat-containing N-terminal plant-type domain-containing protein n=1 Tax=Ficus carica TaxID=3494 RepID=A0AA88E860_FICCA|nr:hypothetical protein TIFTF001_038553 [Ficus carica]
METRTLLCLILFFCTFLHPSLSDSELCHPDDKKVLLEIKNSFNDPDIFVSWDPKTDCCNWTFIACDDDNRVAELVVEDVDCDLVGPIPPEVGDLPYLVLLGFADCPDITGTIPPAIAKLNNLQGLGFRNTSISGPIPEFIGDFKDLVTLQLSHNSFSGSIPNTIGSLPQLHFLDLSYNQLSGPIPGTFESSNKLILIDLKCNKLEGDASVFFPPNKTSIFMIDLSWNLFEFDFSNVHFSRLTLYVDINHNKIYGCLPWGLTELVLLIHLDVSFNRLCGEIPQGGNLQSFPASAYLYNKCLCGEPLPPCYHPNPKVGFI